MDTNIHASSKSLLGEQSPPTPELQAYIPLETKIFLGRQMVAPVSKAFPVSGMNIYHLRTQSPKAQRVKRSYEQIPAKKLSHYSTGPSSEDVETLLKERVLVSNPKSVTANVPKMSSAY